ncbi:MAG: hypothetical protein JEZ03_04055 [Bacteroidales bacterium]|nr:hypothetical protein [Bacteroidales bacterium]
MNTNKLISSVGYIKKKESLSTFKSGHRFDELILEDMAPFPGYYEFFNFPRSKEELFPRSIFLILKPHYRICEDKVLRLTKELELNVCKQCMDAAMAEVSLFNETVPAIRLKMEDTELLPEIVAFYKKQGVEFARTKDIKEYVSIIKVRRWIEMENMEGAIFKALDQPDSFYIQLPGFLEWDQFEEITLKIKNNMTDTHWDAAQAAVYQKGGLIDFIRIYDREPSDKRLKKIYEKYHAEALRLFD